MSLPAYDLCRIAIQEAIKVSQYAILISDMIYQICFSFFPINSQAIARDVTTRGMGCEAPPNNEQLVVCRANFLAAGIFVGQS